MMCFEFQSYQCFHRQVQGSEQVFSVTAIAIYLYNFIFCLHWAAFGILVPWPGIRPVPPAVEARILNQWTTREVPKLEFLTLSLRNTSWPFYVLYKHSLI